MLREKLLYAIHNCSAIDNDFTAQGAVLLDNEGDTENAFDDEGLCAEGEEEKEDDSLQGAKMPSLLELSGIYECMLVCVYI